MGRPARSTLPILVNGTDLRTDDIKRFLKAGLKAKGAENCVQTVEVVQSHGYRSVGWAWVDQKKIRLVLPRGFREGNLHDLRELGQVLEHEVDHILGLDHKDMAAWWD